ncbi:hypothetical protein J6590_075937 [Homalodisca vitripennis]|nr:hypothetical protein J6590_075937 [Homalodisca vitripennis]
MEYREIRLGWHEDWPDNIIWTGETVFHGRGFVNHHSSHYWAEFDLKVTAEETQNHLKTSSQNYWLFSLVRNNELRAVSQHTCTQSLANFVSIKNMIFMQDGAPPHFALNVQEWLDYSFPGCWLDLRGPYEWPACSTDLMPCNFFSGVGQDLNLQILMNWKKVFRKCLQMYLNNSCKSL